MARYTGPNGKTALQKQYLDEKAQALADHLYTQVTEHPSLQVAAIIEGLAKRLQPQLSELTARIDAIELRLGQLRILTDGEVLHITSDGGDGSYPVLDDVTHIFDPDADRSDDHDDD